MIVQKQLENNLILTYSDENYYIYGGDPLGFYSIAVDPSDFNRFYKETNILIPFEELQDIQNVIQGEN